MNVLREATHDQEGVVIGSGNPSAGADLGAGPRNNETSGIFKCWRKSRAVLPCRATTPSQAVHRRTMAMRYEVRRAPCTHPLNCLVFTTSVRAHVRVWGTRVEARGQHQMSSSIIFTVVFDTALLTESGAHQLG